MAVRRYISPYMLPNKASSRNPLVGQAIKLTKQSRKKIEKAWQLPKGELKPVVGYWFVTGFWPYTIMSKKQLTKKFHTKKTIPSYGSKTIRVAERFR